MAAQGTVTVNIIGKADKLQSAFRDSEKAAGGFGNKLDGVGSKVADFGKKVVAMGAVAGAALGAFAVKAVMAASDVEESQSKVNTVFGKGADEVNKWAKGAASSIGLSRGEALKAAGDFGNMFTQMGIGQKEAAKMSTGMTNLAADFASFHNADITSVIDAQSAAFRGEYDSLQKYVPMINAANVEKKALAMTGKANAKALTAEEKALAVNALMYEGAGKAQGDFARTSGGLANQLRILKAEGANFLAAVGEKLLPLALKGLTLFKDWSSVIKDSLAPTFNTIKLGVLAFVAALKDGDVTSDGFVGKMEEIGAALRSFALFVRDEVVPVVERFIGFVKDNAAPIIAAIAATIMGVVIPAFIAWTVATWAQVAAWVALNAPTVAIIAVIAALAAGVVYAYKNFEGFRDVVDGVAKFLKDTVLPIVLSFAEYIIEQFKNLLGWVKQIWPQVQEAISHVINVISGIVRTFVDVIAALWRAWGDDIWGIVKTYWNYIRETIENAIQFIKGLIQTVLAVINGDWGKAWDGIKNMVGAVWDQIGNIVSTGIGVLKGIIGGLGSTLAEAAKGMWDWLPSGLKGVANIAIGIVEFLANKMIEALLAPISVLNKIPGVKSFVPDVPRIHLPRLHSGGVIPGVLGTDTLIRAQAGERILPRGASGSNSGPVVINLTVDGRVLGQITATSLRELQGLNGNLGIEAA